MEKEVPVICTITWNRKSYSSVLLHWRTFRSSGTGSPIHLYFYSREGSYLTITWNRKSYSSLLLHWRRKLSYHNRNRKSYSSVFLHWRRKLSYHNLEQEVLFICTFTLAEKEVPVICTISAFLASESLSPSCISPTGLLMLSLINFASCRYCVFESVFV